MLIDTQIEKHFSVIYLFPGEEKTGQLLRNNWGQGIVELF